MGMKQVNYALENKIILCTGTGFHRRQMLLDTYINDTKYFPFKKIFLSTNDPENLDLVFGNQTPTTHFFPHYGHQLDCLNCIMTSIRNAVNDPEVFDDDIILFKHESYFVNDLYLIRKALGTIVLNNYDMVVQFFRHYNLREWQLTGSFFIKVSAARPLFTDFTELTQFPHPTGSWEASCEYYLDNYVLNQLKRVYKVPCHYEGQDNRLGIYHIPKTHLVRWQIWDKEDYHDLFNDVCL